MAWCVRLFSRKIRFAELVTRTFFSVLAFRWLLNNRQ
jgi:hypothetical protein